MRTKTSENQSVTTLVQTLETLDRELRTVHQDLNQLEHHADMPDHCVAVISKLLGCLKLFTLQVLRVEKHLLDAVLKHYSDTWLHLIVKLQQFVIPELELQLLEHEREFHVYYQQHFPNQNVPSIHSDVDYCRNAYQQLLSQQISFSDDNPVNRRSIGYCIFLLEKVDGFLCALAMGKVPTPGVPTNHEKFVQTVNQLMREGYIKYKYDFEFVFKKAFEMKVYPQLSITRRIKILRDCNVPSTLFPSETSLRFKVISSDKQHKFHWYVVDMEEDELKRVNGIGDRFAEIFTSL